MNSNARWQVTIEAQRYLYTFSKRNVIHHEQWAKLFQNEFQFMEQLSTYSHISRGNSGFHTQLCIDLLYKQSLVYKKILELWTPTNWKKKKDKKVSLLNELGDEKEETFDVRKETQFFDINIIFFSLWNDKWQHRRNASEKMPVYFFFNSCVTCMNWHVVSANYSSLSGNVVAKHQLNMLILQTYL